MDFKLIGSIMLIIGTSIGAGILALPLATAKFGFAGSVLLLCFGWFTMTMGAFLLLEVNLWLPKNSNLVSMAKATVGPIGQLIAWITYILLLYSLLCAYISGGSGLLHNLILKTGLPVPFWGSSVLFTVLFSAIVFLGIRSVDYANRGLMSIKLLTLILLVVLLIPFISTDLISQYQLFNKQYASAIMVTITSFGYAAIIPSLRIYLEGDIKKLKKAILIGSAIPFVSYLAWDAVILGIIPLEGKQGLISILHSKSSTSSLVNVLTHIVSSHSITIITQLFTSICVITSFLGVGLCLSDFLADGFQVEKKGQAKIMIHVLAFVPPLIIVLFFPNAFVKALEYGGIYCVILLMFLPAWMAYKGRYHKKFSNGFRIKGGKPLLIGLILISFLLIIAALID